MELVSALIPLPAMSTQVSARQLLSRSQFLLIIDLLRQSTLTQLGRKLQHTLLGVSATFTTWRIGFPFLLYLQRQPFSLWSLCKYSAIILAWKPPRPSFPGIASAFQHIPTQRCQIQDVRRASSKHNEGCGSFTFFSFTGSLLLKGGFRMDYALCFSKINECSKSKQKEPGLRSSRDWILPIFS